MAQGGPKEFWKKYQLEKTRGGFLPRCQNSLLQTAPEDYICRHKIFLFQLMLWCSFRFNKDLDSAPQIFMYRKVPSSNMYRLEAHAGFFRLLMKKIFDPYVLWPFDKKFLIRNVRQNGWLYSCWKKNGHVIDCLFWIETNNR